MVNWDKLSTFTQNQWKEYLQNLVKTNDKALYRSIILISENQTPEEIRGHISIENNNKGFGKVDAAFLTGMANKIQVGGKLTPKELAICRNKMPKYWRQLYLISKEKMKKKP